MKRIGFLLVLMLVLPLMPAPSQAAYETWTIGAPMTLDSNAGNALQIDETGFPLTEIFIFPEGGLLRAYAIRESPAAWETLPSGVFLVRLTTMSVGQNWNGFPTDNDEATTWTVRAFESITVPAGTFMAYKVEGGLTSNTSILDSVFWFVDGIGIVRQEYYNSADVGNPFDDQFDLVSYSVVGGSGFFPIAEGNTWDFDQAVPTEANSFGSIKSLFD